MTWDLTINLNYLTLLAISLLINLFLTVFLFFKKSTIAYEKQNNYLGFIETKDLLYWLLFIIIFSVLNFTYSYKNQTDIISHWSFAGTIISIILAIIAILFTLYQTVSGDLSSQKINQAVETLENLTNIIDTKSLQDSAENMKKASVLLENHVEDISKQFKGIQERLESTEIGFEKSNNNEQVLISPNSSFPESLLEEFLVNNFNNMATYPKFFLYGHLSAIYIYKDQLSKFKNRQKLNNTLTSIVINYDLNRKMESKDEKNEINLKHTIRGLARGSNGAINSLITNLGIKEMFLTLSPERQKEILGLAKEKLNDSTLLNDLDSKFIDSLFDEI